MKEQDKLFAYNTNQCPRCGPTIRDRHGHCLKCHPASIAFNLRSKQTANIYIACSIANQMTKVGTSTELIEKRIAKLNSRGVGSTNDWVVVYTSKCHRANDFEFKTHEKLKKYRVKGDKYGDVESREIFRCGYPKALEALNQVLEENDVTILESKQHVRDTEKFNFRNLINSDNV